MPGETASPSEDRGDERAQTRSWWPDHWYDWWPLLIGPLAGTVAGVGNWIRPQIAIFHKDAAEPAALVLTGLAALVAVWRASRSRQAIAILLAALAVIALTREIHINALDAAVYASLVGLAVWGFAWRNRVAPDLLAQPRLRVWLVATAFTYVLSQFIARRGLQHVLGDEAGLGQFVDVYQTSIEEMVENAAHLTLLITVWVCRPPRRPS